MSEQKQPLKVFLCHAKADKQQVRRLYYYLRKRRIKPWLDEVDLVGGQDWQVEIPKALATSDAIIICMTKNSVDKEGYIQKEIKFALNKALEMPEGRIFLIPVRFEECEVPFSLSRYQWVDLFDEAGYTRMIKALRSRASQLPRATVEVPKTTMVDEPQNAELFDEQESIKRVIQESTKRETPESAESEHTESQSGSITTSKVILSKKRLFLRIGGLIGIIFALLWFGSLAGFQFPWSGSSATPLPTETTAPKDVPMVLIPEGDFVMGSNSGDPDEKPVHTVYLDSYYIDKYEVTNALYKECVDLGKCQPPNPTNSPTRPHYYDESGFGNYPVIYMSWNMAKNYCEAWRGARLPTEAEWEKAARGTGGLIYPWGNDGDCTRARYGTCKPDATKKDTTTVGSYENGVSPYSVYDMAGNVWEWVEDRYDAYPGNSAKNPDFGTIYHILRGGSWGSDDRNVRSANRLKSRPADTDYRYGFRCAKDANP